MKCKVIISDPWEYAGKTIKGKIIKIFDKENLLFKADSIYNFKNIEGQYFLIGNRHKNTNFSNNILKIPIGGAILSCDYKEELSLEYLLKNCTYCFIGAIKINFLVSLMLKINIFYKNL